MMEEFLGIPVSAWIRLKTRIDSQYKGSVESVIRLLESNEAEVVRLNGEKMILESKIMRIKEVLTE